MSTVECAEPSCTHYKAAPAIDTDPRAITKAVLGAVTVDDLAPHWTVMPDAWTRAAILPDGRTVVMDTDGYTVISDDNGNTWTLFPVSP